MTRFIEGESQTQVRPTPGYLDCYVAEENSVIGVGVFVDELDLGSCYNGRHAYHPESK